MIDIFEYQICNVFDKSIFTKQCAAIECHIPNIIKANALRDVDGSQLQIYTFQNGERIKVKNSTDFGVSIESDVNIEKYFN